MHLQRLILGNVRCVAQAGLEPGRGLNLLIGANGAGKTSILEAIHLLGYGRSFRCRVRDGLIRTGAEAVEVFAHVQRDAAAGSEPMRIGLRHAGSAWTGRLNGQDVDHLGTLCAALPVVTFEPGSHALVTGGGEPRRRQLDWGLFHVEHDKPEPLFLPHWRRYARALKQRNRLLKLGGGTGSQLDAWDQELADAGESITRARLAYLEQLEAHVHAVGIQLMDTLGRPQLQYQPGWPRERMGLADALLQARERDLQYGHSSVGPHRADWQIVWTAVQTGEALSRGQAKLTALALLLGQARVHAHMRGYWPIMLLDDLASELDRTHQQRLLRLLQDSNAQVFVTGTEAPNTIQSGEAQVVMFHVERGKV